MTWCKHVSSKLLNIWHILVIAAEPKAEYACFESDASEKVGDVKEAEVVPVSESNGEDSETKQVTEQDENGSETSRSTFSFDQLKARSDNPVTEIDFKGREFCLVMNVIIPISINGYMVIQSISPFVFPGLSVRWGVPDFIWDDGRSIL